MVDLSYKSYSTVFIITILESLVFVTVVTDQCKPETERSRVLKNVSEVCLSRCEHEKHFYIFYKTALINLKKF